MARLSVNLNKIALLRNSRHTGVPDVLRFARIVLAAGSAGLTVHPRPDERHIRKSDVYELAKLMRPYRPRIELNIEGYPNDWLFKIAKDVKPEQCTLVPDAPTAFTSETGWYLTAKQMKIVLPAIARLKSGGARVILFVEPDPRVISRVVAAGADGIEIYTGGYASAFKRRKSRALLQKCADTAARANAAGLVVNIGHDLNLKNLPALLKQVPFVAEASIGHELTADALLRGFATTVRAYAATLAKSGEAIAAPHFRLAADPLKQFRAWFKDAERSGIRDPNAMTLATSTKQGKPSARTVLLKDTKSKGFIFYTNYKSRKGRDLQENPHASLLFHWPELGRQVRIVGRVEKVSRMTSESYFWSRSRESQLIASISEQSAVIESRDVMDLKMRELGKRFAGKRIPLPPQWGGYCLKPKEIEFWQSGEHRLHDRVRYVQKGRRWKRERLAPE